MACSRKIAALVLAAGEARRMGCPKIFMEKDGKPMIGWVLASLLEAGVTDLFIVLGSRYQDAAVYLSFLEEANDAELIVNPRFLEGMGSSIAVGFSAIPDRYEAVLLALADMPSVTASTLTKILEKYDSQRKEETIVIPLHQNRRGHPVLFGRFYFNELRELKGDRGARSLVQKYEKNVVLAEVDTPAILTDIDTQEEWKQWKESRS